MELPNPLFLDNNLVFTFARYIISGSSLYEYIANLQFPVLKYLIIPQGSIDLYIIKNGKDYSSFPFLNSSKVLLRSSI